MADAAIENAKRIKQLLDAGDTTPRTVADAADMLQVLGTEVTRQRLAIGHFLYGQIDRHELRRISETWNGDR
jgi:hypothetical protein